MNAIYGAGMHAVCHLELFIKQTKITISITFQLQSTNDQNRKYKHFAEMHSGIGSKSGRDVTFSSIQTVKLKRKFEV